MKIKNLRWIILSLIVLITIINYIDRGTLNYMWVANTKETYTLRSLNNNTASLQFNTAVFDSTSKSYYLISTKRETKVVEANQIQKVNDTTILYLKRGGIAYDLGLVNANDSQSVIDDKLKKMYAYIYMFFMVAYGISQLVSGKVYDAIGTRNGFMLSAFIWGLADMLTSLARGVASLSFFRVLLGLGEAGPWPGTVKSNSEWFPVKERALAQGLFGAGGSIGNIVAPIIISALYLKFGWQNTFLIVGSLGILWIIPWYIINKAKPSQHPWITEEEKLHILGSEHDKATLAQEKAKTWKQLLKDKRSFAVVFGRFFLDPIWWMFVAWLPIYLSNKFKLDIKQVAFSAWVPYVGAAIGAIAGGLYSGHLIKKGYLPNKARKRAVLIGASVVLPAMILASQASTSLQAVMIMGFILGGFQFAIVNIQTMASDFQTGKSVGSLSGLGGAAAVFGTIITMYLVPVITSGNNWLPFFVMGALLVPLGVISVFFFSNTKANA